MMAPTHWISTEIERDVLAQAIRTYRRQLREDEFRDSDRLGEYGRLVPTATRSGSQPDARAPTKRLNAFYTYCACDYLLRWEARESASSIERIDSFVRRRLSSSARYITSRARDGYHIGTVDSAPHEELNIRHTLGLGLTSTLLNRDRDRNRRLLSLLLREDLPNQQGGWCIWEGDVVAGGPADPIASSYALILLDHYWRQEFREPEREKLQHRMAATQGFLMDCLEPSVGLWLTGLETYAQAVQMSAWYASLMLPFLYEEDVDLAHAVVRGVSQSLDEINRDRIERENISADVLIRVACLSLSDVTRDVKEELIAEACDVLRNAILSPLAAGELSTYALTRLLGLLRKIQVRKSDEEFGGQGFLDKAQGVACLLGSFFRGYFGP